MPPCPPPPALVPVPPPPPCPPPLVLVLVVVVLLLPPWPPAPEGPPPPQPAAPRVDVARGSERRAKGARKRARVGRDEGERGEVMRWGSAHREGRNEARGMSGKEAITRASAGWRGNGGAPRGWGPSDAAGAALGVARGRGWAASLRGRASSACPAEAAQRAGAEGGRAEVAATGTASVGPTRGRAGWAHRSEGQSWPASLLIGPALPGRTEKIAPSHPPRHRLAGQDRGSGRDAMRNVLETYMVRTT